MLNTKNVLGAARLEAFMAMKIQAMAFCVMTSCSHVVGYQHFRGLFYLPL